MQLYIFTHQMEKVGQTFCIRSKTRASGFATKNISHNVWVVYFELEYFLGKNLNDNFVWQRDVWVCVKITLSQHLAEQLEIRKERKKKPKNKEKLKLGNRDCTIKIQILFTECAVFMWDFFHHKFLPLGKYSLSHHIFVWRLQAYNCNSAVGENFFDGYFRRYDATRESGRKTWWIHSSEVTLKLHYCHVQGLV